MYLNRRVFVMNIRSDLWKKNGDCIMKRKINIVTMHVQLNYILVTCIINTSTNYAQIISVIKYQHDSSKCLNIHCSSEDQDFWKTYSPTDREMCALREYSKFHKIQNQQNSVKLVTDENT